jgi:hypothetical protein
MIIVADEVTDLVGHAKQLFPLFSVECDGKATKPIYARTRNGFTPKLREELLKRFAALETDERSDARPSTLQ